MRSCEILSLSACGLGWKPSALSCTLNIGASAGTKSPPIRDDYGNQWYNGRVASDCSGPFLLPACTASAPPALHDWGQQAATCQDRKGYS